MQLIIYKSTYQHLVYLFLTLLDFAYKAEMHIKRNKVIQLQVICTNYINLIKKDYFTKP